VSYQVEQWRALGTYVVLIVADGPRAGQARGRAEHLLAQVDAACSRFRADSDLVRANAQAGSWCPVSPLLVEAVEVALAVAAETGGLVDPTLGLALAANGYDRDLSEVRTRPASPGPPGPSALPAPPLRTGAWREVATDPAGRVRVPEGVALDLGATGKAFACDRIVAALADDLGLDCLLSLGGDVAMGRASRLEHHWSVSVSERPGGEIAETIPLDRGAVATSTTVHRTWTAHGRVQHHLLDPATGTPVRRTWRTVTARATSCVQANAATTASLVLGEQAPAWLSGRRIPARLVAQDGGVLTLGSWPELLPEGLP
jgi:thiamine biosynthesis lipoprotein